MEIVSWLELMKNKWILQMVGENIPDRNIIRSRQRKGRLPSKDYNPGKNGGDKIRRRRPRMVLLF